MYKADEEQLKISQLSENFNKLKTGKIGSFERRLIDGVAEKEVSIESLIIKFKEEEILDKTIEALIPENFTLVSEDVMKKAYSQSNENVSIFVNEIATVELIFSFNERLDKFSAEEAKNKMLDLSRKIHYGAKYFEHGIDNFTGADIAFFDTLVEMEGVKFYNMIFLMNINKKMILGTFKCMENDMKYWKPMFKGIIKSIKVIEG